MEAIVGKSLIWTTMGVTLILYLMGKSNLAVLWLDPWLTASQILALLGSTLLTWTFILGSRAKILENWFGGLDRVVRIHHIVGGLAFVMLIHHPLLLVINVLPQTRAALQYIFVSESVSYSLGVLALDVMILALLLTLVIKLPYHIWIKTHDLLGLTLLLATLHIYLIDSDVSRFVPLRLWMFILLAIGIFAYIYKVFLYRWFGPRYKYVVEKTRQIGGIVEVYLRSMGEKLVFKPGQFGFVSFGQESLKEAHPFSFASAPDSPVIRFSVKILGDYTRRLNELKIGTKARLWGAYGKLGKGFYGDKGVVCLVGGIGITPFLGMLEEEEKQPRQRKIYLFYTVKTSEEAVYDQELRTKQDKLPELSYQLWVSSEKGRLAINKIAEIVGTLVDKRFYLCGPTGMMEAFLEQLQKMGVKRNNIIYEDFSFK